MAARPRSSKRPALSVVAVWLAWGLLMVAPASGTPAGTPLVARTTPRTTVWAKASEASKQKRSVTMNCFMKMNPTKNSGSDGRS
jgi:hypothetical protein